MRVIVTTIYNDLSQRTLFLLSSIAFWLNVLWTRAPLHSFFRLAMSDVVTAFCLPGGYENNPLIYHSIFIFPFLLHHYDWWTTTKHWGGCGQSCGCCRAHNPEDANGSCEPCATGWILTCTSKSASLENQHILAQVFSN